MIRSPFGRFASAMLAGALLTAATLGPASAATSYSLALQNSTTSSVSVKVETQDGTVLTHLTLDPGGKTTISDEGRLFIVADITESNGRELPARTLTIDASRKSPKTIALQKNGNTYSWK